MIPRLLHDLSVPLEVFTNKGDRLYWLYLFSSYSIALVILIVRRQISTGSRGFLKALLPWKMLSHQSSINDYLFAYCNAIFQPAFIVALFSGASVAMADLTNNHLSSWFPALQAHYKNWSAGIVIWPLLLALMTDFSMFLAHYLQHRIPWLWEFHKVHHSAEVMTPITVYRMHPVDNILVFSLSGMAGGLAFGIIHFLAGPNITLHNISGESILVILFYLAGYNLRHSHIWLGYGSFWSQILISPAQHQIHHSTHPQHFNKNMGFIFAIWDKLFGTLYVPQTRENLSFGLGRHESQQFTHFWSLYLMPFVSIIQKFRLRMLANPSRIASVLVFLLAVAPAVYLSQTAKSPLATSGQLYMENMTWTEIRLAINSGVDTLIIPTGGTEQNGPHVITGKHHYIVRYTSGRIAEKLGQTLVAPVIDYVPEGAISPPNGHMKFVGTLSVTDKAFEAILESTARSAKQHGFKNIVLLGDSGGNQVIQSQVANKLNTEWRASDTRVLQASDYYSGNGQLNYLIEQGFTPAEIGSHAGIRDTSELMAVYPEGVRNDKLNNHMVSDYAVTGADGDASKASPILGKALLELKINSGINQIKAFRAEPR